MIHYDYVEWLLYKNRALSDEKIEEMEEHLYDCHICMEIFLSLIDEKEVNSAKEFVPENFTSNVISNISKTKVKNIRSNTNKKPFKYPFGYFVAVASVTIVISLSGFYTNLVDSVPKVSASINDYELDKPNLIVDLSNKIISRTSSFIVSIENFEINKEGK